MRLWDTGFILQLRSVPTPHDYTLAPDVLAKAVALAHARNVVYFGATLTTLLVLYAFVRLGIGTRLRDFAERHTRWLVLQLALFVPPFLLLLALAELPWVSYRHAVALRVGLSVEQWGPWFRDWTKGELVNIAIGVLIAWLFCAIVRRSPRRYWLWFWLVSLPLMVAAVYLAPLVLDPMFNRFEPLARTHPELVAPIEQVLHNARVEIPASRLFEMNASDKTNGLNAYTTGFGSSKRVVLWDTIIRKEPLPELMTTFGHELGHYALHHIAWGLLLQAAGLFVAMYAAYRFIGAILSRAGGHMNIRSPGDLAALPLFVLFALTVSFLSDPLTSAISRAFEHQADVYSLEVTRGVIPQPGEAAARAFQIEGQTDLEVPDPNPFIVWWLYDHPPTRDRLRFSLDWQAARQPRL